MKNKSEVIWKAICTGVVAFFIVIGIMRSAAELSPKEEINQTSTYSVSPDYAYLHYTTDYGAWTGSWVCSDNENFDKYVEENEVYESHKGTSMRELTVRTPDGGWATGMFFEDDENIDDYIKQNDLYLKLIREGRIK